MNARYLPRRAQGDPDNLAGEMDTSGASDHNEDGIHMPKKLLNVSELERKRLEQHQQTSLLLARAGLDWTETQLLQ